MTQMLLFDSPATTAENVPVAATAQAAESASVADSNAADSNVAAQLNHQSGMHHMGDLARLVLLRYELVAKRRAVLAARQKTDGR